MANPVITNIDTYSASVAKTQSEYATFSYAITAGFEALIPVEVVNPSNVSAGAEVYVHPSQDGGASYDTEGSIVSAFNRSGGATQIKSFRLRTGIYQIRVLVGGGSSATWSVGFAATAQEITAYT